MLNSALITLNGKFVTQRRLEAITNNLANAATAGFKLSKPAFKVAAIDPAAGNEAASQNHTINELDTHIFFSEAPLVETGNTLDLAIEGNGFFVVTTNDGTAYTRNGQFTLNKDRKLVTTDGSPVMGQNGEIILSGKEIMIENDGSIYVDKMLTGSLKIVDFSDKRSLRNLGKSSFTNTNADNQETVPTKFAVKQGFYEASNVNVMTEMVDMINVLRAYESYTKVDQSLNDLMTKLIDVVRF
ncbi:MAG: flagellar basal-body rod protein FlgF [Syntrophus sp. (in: bacteria)]|nr:flagellar basal-body rod protein FlgF [Syntrophus sp. (in: bacteria)]